MNSVKINAVHCFRREHSLLRPYDIAYRHINVADILYVVLEADNGLHGLGSAAPAESITGEKVLEAEQLLNEKLRNIVMHRDIREIHSLSNALEMAFPGAPAARAAAEIALYDLFSKRMDMPLARLLGQVHMELPTSVTIGIQPFDSAIREARTFVDMGFMHIKFKIGNTLDADIELVRKAREYLGSAVGIRVDADQAYSIEELKRFLSATTNSRVALIEQPLQRQYIQEMLFEIPEADRMKCVADESLIEPSQALALANFPRPFGVFNVKLMKCGGIRAAQQIANISRLTGIPLLWDTMDESTISVVAALHLALASPATRYLDLSSTPTLSNDIAGGGFLLRDGKLSITDQPGLGVKISDTFFTD